jgi:hypothetical protein
MNLVASERFPYVNHHRQITGDRCQAKALAHVVINSERIGIFAAVCILMSKIVEMSTSVQVLKQLW